MLVELQWQGCVDGNGLGPGDILFICHDHEGLNLDIFIGILE